MIFFKGIKPALQFPAIWPRKKLRYEIIITDKMFYDVNDSIEQKDFIKVTGLSDGRFNNHSFAALLAARYNLEEKVWEFVPYYHFNNTIKEGFTNVVGKFKGHFNTSEIIKAKIGDIITGEFEYSYGSMLTTIQLNFVTKVQTAVEIVNDSSWFRVMGWHGGTKPSNRTYNFRLNFFTSSLINIIKKN
jgi:hypothetical protein